MIRAAEVKMDGLPVDRRLSMFLLCRSCGVDPLTVWSVEVVDVFRRFPGKEAEVVSALRFLRGPMYGALLRPMSAPLPAWWQPA